MISGSSGESVGGLGAYGQMNRPFPGIVGSRSVKTRARVAVKTSVRESVGKARSSHLLAFLVHGFINTVTYDWPILDAEGLREGACIPGRRRAEAALWRAAKAERSVRILSEQLLRQKRPTRRGRGSSGAQRPRHATTMARHRLLRAAAPVHPEYPRHTSPYL